MAGEQVGRPLAVELFRLQTQGNVSWATSTANLRGHVAFCASLLASPSVRAEDRPAEKILAEINALPLPTRPNDLTNVAAVEEYKSKYPIVRDKRVELIG